MARKKAAETEIPEPEPAQIGADPTELDTEERRRLGNQRRRFVRRQHRRRGWLAVVEERDPELYEELLELRRYNPQDFRKRLVRWCVQNDVYTDRRYTSREMPPQLPINQEFSED